LKRLILHERDTSKERVVDGGIPWQQAVTTASLSANEPTTHHEICGPGKDQNTLSIPVDSCPSEGNRRRNRQQASKERRRPTFIGAHRGRRVVDSRGLEEDQLSADLTQHNQRKVCGRKPREAFLQRAQASRSCDALPTASGLEPSQLFS
jgi:hypothetical protein